MRVRARPTAIAVLLAVIVVAGTVARAIATGSTRDAIWIIVWSLVAILAGVLLGLGLFVVFVPTELRRRAVSREHPSAVVLGARMNRDVSAQLRRIAASERWKYPENISRFGIVISGDRTGLTFWSASKPVTPIGTVAWRDVGGVTLLPVAKGERGKPRICLSIEPNSELKFFVGAPASIGLTVADREVLEQLVESLSSLRQESRLA